MSKSVGKVLSYTPAGALYNAAKKGTKARYDSAPVNDYVNYLANYDTSKVDNTLSNLQDYALNQSKNVGNMNWNMPEINKDEWIIPQVNESDWNFNTANAANWYFPTVNKDDWYMPNIQQSDYNVPEVNKSDWTFNVNSGDEARRQAQDATYNAYMDYLNPQFERQIADYSTMLQNKGLPVGSEAYERAMSDLQDRQNAATNQAAYQSVLAGQNAYAQDLQNQIAAGNFGNTAVNNFYNAQLAANQGRNDYLNAQLAANQNQAMFNDAQLSANKAAEAYSNALLKDNDARSAFYDAQQGANTARASLIDAQNAVNGTQAAYLAQILAALGDAPTDYDIQGDVYAARANKAANEYTAKQQTTANRLSLVNGLLSAGSRVIGSAIGGAGA